MTNTHQQIRTKLEEQNTHVTFIRSVRSGTIWTVGEEMNEIFIGDHEKLEDLHINQVLRTIRQGAKGNLNGDKFQNFFLALRFGAIQLDANLYHKYTSNQLYDLYRQAKELTQ